MDFSFYDSTGVKKYSSTSITDDLRKNDQLNPDDVKIILLQTPSFNDSVFVRQSSIVDSIAAVKKNIIFVVSCPSDKYPQRYFTNKETALRLSGEMKGHRIAVLNANGMVIYRNNAIVSTRMLQSILNRK